MSELKGYLGSSTLIHISQLRSQDPEQWPADDWKSDLPEPRFSPPEPPTSQGLAEHPHPGLIFRTLRQREHSIPDHKRVLVVQCASTIDEAITLQPREGGHVPASVRGRHHVNVSKEHIRLHAGVWAFDSEQVAVISYDLMPDKAGMEHSRKD